MQNAINNIQCAVVNLVVYTSNGNYTVPSDLIAASVQVQAAGGAGGGAASIAGQGAAGSGGGAGEYRQGLYSIAALGGAGASIAVTVGTGGTGVSNAAGNAGADSIFGALITAKGGSGGAVGVSGTYNQSAVTAGGSAGSGGDLSVNGAAGAGGFSSQDAGVYWSLPGAGGIPRFGLANETNPLFNTVATQATGIAATVAGAGGSGGSSLNGGTDVAGGDGANGRVVIYEYKRLP